MLPLRALLDLAGLSGAAAAVVPPVCFTSVALTTSHRGGTASPSGGAVSARFQAKLARGP